MLCNIGKQANIRIIPQILLKGNDIAGSSTAACHELATCNKRISSLTSTTTTTGSEGETCYHAHQGQESEKDFFHIGV